VTSIVQKFWPIQKCWDVLLRSSSTIKPWPYWADGCNWQALLSRWLQLAGLIVPYSFSGRNDRESVYGIVNIFWNAILRWIPNATFCTKTHESIMLHTKRGVIHYCKWNYGQVSWLSSCQQSASTITYSMVEAVTLPDPLVTTCHMMMYIVQNTTAI